MWTIIKNNPVLVTGVTAALINLAVSLGYLSKDVGDATAAVVESIVILVLALLARREVTKHWPAGTPQEQGDVP